MDKNWFTRFHQEEIDPVYLSNMIRATEYFVGWFNNCPSVTYTKMLIKMHRIVCDGYKGCSGGKASHNVSHEFRDFSWCGDSFILKREWFNETLVQCYPSVHGTAGSFLTHGLVSCNDGGGDYTLVLVGHEHTPSLLQTLGTMMDALWDEFSLVTLARYIHLFVITHPFNKVNFSLCMAQVNALLDVNGYNTIYHEYLDFKCFAYDGDVIEDIFKNMVGG